MSVHEISARSKQAFYTLSASDLIVRNHFLLNLAEELIRNKNEIFSANQSDFVRAKEEGLSAPLLKRLIFDENKLLQIQDSLHSLALLPDPLNKTVFCHEISPGLKLYRVTCAIGVIGIIFESRPDALIQIASLAIKSGNSALLKGGHEAAETNQQLILSIQSALKKSGLPVDSAQLLHSREDVNEMLKEERNIDLLIPRGSNQFVRYLMNNTHIPVLGHSDGICHVYVDSEAKMETALKVALDSKIQNLSVCNAEETLLVHEAIAQEFIPRFEQLLKENHVEIRGDGKTREIINCKKASEEDWATEYLDAILSIRVVNSLQQAIDHINLYGSHHTDCIITENSQNASIFMNEVDSSSVYQNVSTRFADGFVYGFGAEVGIATGKLHARGPMGLDGLVTYKYKLIGHGQTMAEVKSGKIQYTHKVISENCPL